MVTIARKRGLMKIPTPNAKVSIPLDFFSAAMDKLNLSQRDVIELSKISKEKIKGTKNPTHLRSKIVIHQSQMEPLFRVDCLNLECHPPKLVLKFIDFSRHVPGLLQMQIWWQ